MHRIAIVEDDRRLAQQLNDLLRERGWQVFVFHSAAGLLESLPRQRFDLVLLDLGLPDQTGLQLIRSMGALGFEQSRGSLPEIVMLTGIVDESMLEEAFALGVRDYVHKPYRGRELVARLSAILRRQPAVLPTALPTTLLPAAAPHATHPHSATPHAAISGLRLEADNPLGPGAWLKGRWVSMTEKEYQCAAYLSGRMGETISRDEIRSQVWGYNSQVETRTVDTHVSRIRKKLLSCPGLGIRLAPVYGVGYRMEVFS
ncbi:MAG: response regulator transcription factor [Betaproteobacteria bacterium]|nr:response regulator transcription factor [Betaproteobacteria bacterium]